MFKHIFAFFLLISDAYASKQVQTKIEWEYHNFPLSIELHAAAPGISNEISRTRTLNFSAKEVFNSGITKGPIKPNFSLEKESYKTFLLVVRNSTSEPYYFYAVPHTIKPPEAALGYHFQCLCNHSIFKVEPNSIWYRVVRLQLLASFDESKFALKHQIVGVDKTKAEGEWKSRLSIGKKDI